MSWASPMLALWGALATVPALLLLYFLKLRRRTVDVSTTLLWRRAARDLQANAPFQRLRRNVLLLLQLLILAALLGAVAQPELRTDLPVGQRTVILIDRSASMSATDAEAGSRLEAARRRALELVESLREPGPFGSGGADEAMVIAFGATAEVLVPLTSDKQRLRAAIESIEPTDTHGRLEQAMRLARARSRPVEAPGASPDPASGEDREDAPPAGPRPAIHLFSDGGLPDAGSVAAGVDERLVFHAVGSREARNIGITALRAERSYRDPDRVSIFVGVQNTGAEARRIDIELQAAGQVRLYPLTVPSSTRVAEQGVQPGKASTIIEITHPTPGIVRAALTGEAMAGDVLAVDDVGWVTLGPARRMRVACVTPGNLFLRAALEGMDLAELAFFEPGQFGPMLASGEAGRFDVLVLDRWLPTNADGEAVLPRGRSVVLGRVPTGEPGIWLDEPGPGGALLVTSPGHEALRDVSLGGVEVIDAPVTRIDADAGADVLVETAAGPAIFELTGTDRRAIVVAFDTLESTWPWDVSYPVFLASAIESLAGGAGIEGKSVVRTGAVVSPRLPAGARNVLLTRPNEQGDEQGEATGSREVAPDADGRVVIGPLTRAGVYELSWRGEPGLGDRREGGRAVRSIAANVLSPVESDVRVARRLETASSVVSATESGRATRRVRLWPWLILVAMGVLMVEWWVYNRRAQI